MTSVSSQEVDQPSTAVADAHRPYVKRVVLIGVAAALVIAGAGVVAYSMAGDVPRGIRVLGVDLGAASRSAAERALHEEFDGRADEPVAVDLDGTIVTIAPKDIAMSLDVGATVGRAVNSPAKFVGTRTVAPVVRLDEARLEAVLRRRIDPKRITLVRPAIAYVGLTPRPTYPKAGLDLDPKQAASTVRTVWLTGRGGDLTLAERQPAMRSEEVDALVDGLATAAVAADVTVTAGPKSFTVDRTAIARSLLFRPDGAGRLTPVIDGDRLHAAAAKQFATVETAPGAATISLTDGKPAIVASTAGDVVDLARLATDLVDVLPNAAPRTVAANLVRADAGTTDSDLARLGVQEKVSTFTTFFTGGARSPRSQNIMTIAKAVDGAIVRPGETFSLNAHTGERDYDAGYHDAPVIVGGKLEPGVGGGASQFTTTLFNAAYYAGLQDVEHKPHSFYFSRYPAVIESTIFYPTLDLKFKNTTPYGILIDTSTTSRSVTVSMWSTKVYDSVRTERGPRRAATSPPTVYREPGPRCISSSGLPGFTQDAWRIIRKDGKEITREKFTWRYDPEPRFVCAAQP